MNMPVSYQPIGVIHSGHTRPEETPIQPVYAEGCEGKAEVFPEFAPDCRIWRVLHIYLLYHMHKVEGARLTVKPFLRTWKGRVRDPAPCRPNPIGLSIVKLVRREENILYLDGVDFLDGTPLLDIKPYSARFDRRETTRNGWQDEVDEQTAWQRGTRSG